jgi:hypothetical protein
MLAGAEMIFQNEVRAPEAVTKLGEMTNIYKGLALEQER